MIIPAYYADNEIAVSQARPLKNNKLLLSGIISGRFLDAFGTDCRYNGKQIK